MNRRVRCLRHDVLPEDSRLRCFTGATIGTDKGCASSPRRASRRPLRHLRRVGVVLLILGDTIALTRPYAPAGGACWCASESTTVRSILTTGHRPRRVEQVVRKAEAAAHPRRARRQRRARPRPLLHHRSRPRTCPGRGRCSSRTRRSGPRRPSSATQEAGEAWLVVSLWTTSVKFTFQCSKVLQ